MKTIDTSATREVLLEVLIERQHQIEDHGWTPDNDDRHGPEDMAWLVARRAVELCNASAVQVVDVRRLFVEMAAISVAAIEAIDRKAQVE